MPKRLLVARAYTRMSDLGNLICLGMPVEPDVWATIDGSAEPHSC